MHFLEDYSIIHALQSGNRKFHSTESALLYFTDEILKTMDEKRISVVVPLDMTKAFSTIRHDIPLAKLRRIGISSVWSTTSKKNIQTLQFLKNLAARIVLGLKKYDHISEVLKSLGWLDINHKLMFNFCFHDV